MSDFTGRRILVALQDGTNCLREATMIKTTGVKEVGNRELAAA